MAKDYSQLAKDIIQNVGGKENVSSVMHCVTRVRFVLKDEDKADDEAVKGLKGVLTLVKQGGQYQVVVGNEVNQIYDAIVKEGNFVEGGEVDADEGDEDSLVAAAKKRKESTDILSRFLGLVSGIFSPVLGLLCAGGMVKALLVLLSLVGAIDAEGGTYTILSAVGDAVFYFFPIVLGWSAAKKFGLKETYGMVLGGVLVYPTIVAAAGGEAISTLFAGTPFAADVQLTFLGIPVILRDYSTSVIPIILVTWISSYIYKWIKRVCPAVVQSFMVPLVTILCGSVLGLLLFGPIAMFIQNCLSQGVIFLVGLNAGIAGLVIGSLWSILVMFGLHWAVIPFFAINIAQYGYDVINPLIYAGSIATMGSVLGVILREKDAEEKSLEIPALISTFFGVNEPSLYGVLIPRKKVMLSCFLAAGIGGAIAGFSGAKLWAFGASGIFGTPCFINPAGVDGGFIGLMVGAVVAFVFGLVTAMFFGAEKD